VTLAVANEVAAQMDEFYLKKKKVDDGILASDFGGRGIPPNQAGRFRDLRLGALSKERQR